MYWRYGYNLYTKKVAQKFDVAKQAKNSYRSTLAKRVFCCDVYYCLLICPCISMPMASPFFISHELKYTSYLDSQRKQYSRTEVDFMEFKVDKWCVTEKDFQFPFLKHQHNSFSLLCLKLKICIADIISDTFHMQSCKSIRAFTTSRTLKALKGSKLRTYLSRL